MGGGTSQTVVNCQAGAKTQVAQLVTVALIVLTVLFLAPMITLMPQATLAAVVIATSVGLIGTAELQAIWRLRHMEFWWGLCAAVGVVLLGTLKGILVAVIVSMLALVYEACHSPVYVLRRKPGTNVFRAHSAAHPNDESFPGLLLVRIEGRLFFANAQYVGERIWELIDEAKPLVLVLDCSAIPNMEYTAVRMLIGGEEKLRDAGITLWLAGLTPVMLDLIRRSPLGKTLDTGRMCLDLAQAISRYQARASATVSEGKSAVSE